MHHSRLIRTLAATAVGLTALVGISACTTADGGDDGPLMIGASLPMTGPVADVAEPAFQGYELWQEQINEAGGLLGRQVEFTILDDGFDQEQVVTNYTKLIGQDKVDLLFGTISSFLNLPASTVAEKNGMLYVEPSGGASEIFERGYTRLFFAQPGTTETLPDEFVAWIESLPEDERPATAAYITATDPNTEPAVALFEEKLGALGIETVYSDKYAPEQADFSAAADAIKRAAPDLLIQGALAEDGINLVRSLQAVGFGPSVLYQTNTPTGPGFAEGIGEANTEGIFSTLAWSPASTAPGSQEFVAAYEERYGSTPDDNAAASYVTAQIVQAAVEAVGEIDQDKLSEWLHANSVQTIFGELSWDERGVPEGTLLLGQWQGGELQIVRPADVASAEPVTPKPNWVQ
jgi:branched-chain amino acid transport system substrate-binding protein